MRTSANDVVAIAQSWIGRKESDGTHKEIIDVYNSQKPLPRKYKVKYTDAWCATFVSALFVKARATNLITTECSCEKMIIGMKRLGIFIEDENRIPSKGDIVFYDWQDIGTGDDKGSSDHVGIVESVNGNTFVVIEGNKNGTVGRRNCKVNQKYLRGFAVPKYSTTTVNNSSVKTNEQIAKEVIAGKWGNGNERKMALTKAGYNYNTIQSLVNSLSTEVKKSNEEIAKEVVAGKWGNGNERKTALTKAGYDYTTIQSLVNKLLKG